MRALLLIAILGACSSSTKPAHLSSDEANKLLIDRNWLDVWPASREDKLHVYRFVPSMGGGVFQDRTVFKGTFELFSFHTHDDKIDFTLHHTEQRVSSTFAIDPIEPVKGAPFDLRLTITDDPRGPRVYYGMRSESKELLRALGGE